TIAVEFLLAVGLLAEMGGVFGPTRVFSVAAVIAPVAFLGVLTIARLRGISASCGCFGSDTSIAPWSRTLALAILGLVGASVSGGSSLTYDEILVALAAAFFGLLVVLVGTRLLILIRSPEQEYVNSI